MFETISAFVRDVIGALLLAISILIGIVATGTVPAPLEQPATTTPAQTTEDTFGVALLPSAPKKEERGVTLAPAVSTPAAPLPSASTPTTVPLPTKSIEEINTSTRDALVNIICMTAAGGPLNALSGSGVFVDSRGVILTNAHVAQYLLLSNYPQSRSIECVVRTGAPAAPKYRAKVLFIPPAWVEVNASKITQNSPTGTGENDFAFLLVDQSINPETPLPSSFPAVSMSTTEPELNDSIFLAAYPAGFLDGITVSMNLFIASTLSSIKERYTFDNPANIDLISVGGTIVSQGGSSGGAAVETRNGSLVGILVTATAAMTTAERDLRAITLAHINRSLAKASQGGIAGLLTGNISEKATEFNQTTAPALKQKLIDALK